MFKYFEERARLNAWRRKLQTSAYHGMPLTFVHARALSKGNYARGLYLLGLTPQEALTYYIPRPRPCAAVMYGSATECAVCGTSWDTNDDDAPNCAPFTTRGVKPNE